MDIFDRIIAATSMNEKQRKLKAIPLLQELVTLTTGEECFLKLNEKNELLTIQCGQAFKQISVKGDSASALVRDVFDNI